MTAIESTTLTITRVRFYEYVMPMRRGFGTSRGVTERARNIVIQLAGEHAGRSVVGVGEGVPRSAALTGDTKQGSWSFLLRAGRYIEGRRLTLGNRVSSLDAIRAVMVELQDLAAEAPPKANPTKPYRGTLAGIDIALLDLVAKAQGLTVSALLGQQRTDVGVSAGTISTVKSRSEFAERTRKDARRFPMSRYKATGDLAEAQDLTRLIAQTNRSAGADKPVWVDVNEGFGPADATAFVEWAAELMLAGDLPARVIVEQPVSKQNIDGLVALQRRADVLLSGRRRRATVRALWNGRRSPSRGRNTGPLKLTIIADEGLWDVDDLRRLQQLGGVGGINIKVPKVGGLLPALDLARAAVSADPDIEIYVGGMLATSDITSWALRSLALAMPRLDFYTSSPPSNVAARIGIPHIGYRNQRTNVLANQIGTGIGVELSLGDLGPYVTRSARFPEPAVIGPVEDERPNRFDLPHLERFGRTNLDSHLLEAEALKAGLNTVRYDPLHFAATRPGHSGQIGFAWTAGIQTSKVSMAMTGSKQLTRALLRQAGIAVPEGRRFRRSQRTDAIAYANRLGWPVVVKPQAGTGGVGVTTNIGSVAELTWAIDAVAATRYTNFVVERHVDGEAYRFIVLHDRVLSVVYRRPASVLGDGVSTVAELIERQNDLRMGLLRLQARPLRIDDRVRFQLDRQGLTWDSVPESGRRVALSTAGSVTQGGESVQVLDETHQSLLDEAVRAVAAIPGLNYAGVDFLIPDHRKPLADQHAAICEINSSPASGSQHFPMYGPARNVSRALVEDQCNAAGLPVDDAADELLLHLEVRGRVQAVGYRQWMARAAREFGVAGWVRNSDDPTLVEACLAGPAGPVAALASLAIRGPAQAQLMYVRCRHFHGDQPTGRFAVHR